MSIYKVVLSLVVVAAAVVFFGFENQAEDTVASSEPKAVFLAGKDD